MIFVPLLHYFKCKNSYSGNEYGLRYRMIPASAPCRTRTRRGCRKGGKHPHRGLLAGPLDH